MRRYQGHRVDQDHVVVTVEVDGGAPQDLPDRLRLRNHSPTGYEWGYNGSGPAQLALAIVCDVLGVPSDATEPGLFDEDVDPRLRRALDSYQAFKDDHVAKWGAQWWILDEDVLRCIERHEIATSCSRCDAQGACVHTREDHADGFHKEKS